MSLMEARSAQLHSAGETAESGLIKGMNGGDGLDVLAVGAVVYLSADYTVGRTANEVRNRYDLDAVLLYQFDTAGNLLESHQFSHTITRLGEIHCRSRVHPWPWHHPAAYFFFF